MATGTSHDRKRAVIKVGDRITAYYPHGGLSGVVVRVDDFNGDAYLVKLDRSGDTRWMRRGMFKRENDNE